MGREKGKANDRATVISPQNVKIEDIKMCIERC
jgi:hypothetical protein